MHKRIIAVAAGLAALATTATVAATAAVGAPARTSAALPTVSFSLDGKTVTAPSTVPSGAVSVSVNVAKEKMGDLALVRLDPGVSLGQAFARVQAAHGDPNGLIGYAAIIADHAVPQGTSVAFQTTLTPGNYAALDVAVNGKPPAATFTVTKAAHEATLPHAAATFKEIEFGFTGPSVWHVGELIRFENAGYVTHMVVGGAVADKADGRKVMKLLKAGKDKSAEKLLTSQVSFFDVNSPGAMQQQRITAKPGTYVVACFMTTGDGREHTRLGMEKMVTIK